MAAPAFHLQDYQFIEREDEFENRNSATPQFESHTELMASRDGQNTVAPAFYVRVMRLRREDEQIYCKSAIGLLDVTPTRWSRERKRNCIYKCSTAFHVRDMRHGGEEDQIYCDTIIDLPRNVTPTRWSRERKRNCIYICIFDHLSCKDHATWRKGGADLLRHHNRFAKRCQTDSIVPREK